MGHGSFSFHEDPSSRALDPLTIYAEGCAKESEVRIPVKLGAGGYKMDVVRACHKCREYVPVIDTVEGQRRVKAFEATHRGHPIGMVAFDEVGSYSDASAKLTSVES